MSDTASEIAGLRAELAAQTARAQAAERDMVQARARASCTQAMVEELKPEIARLRRDKYGLSSGRRARLIDRPELQLEELQATATGDALAAEQAAAQDKTRTVHAFTRRNPVRKPFPAHLPRERVVIEAPTSRSCCGSGRIVKMGEVEEGHKTVRGTVLPTTTETPEVIARRWQGDPAPPQVEIWREKFTCRTCGKISRVRRIRRSSSGRSSRRTAPFHVIPRGWAGRQPIAMVAFEKYGQHQPLNRQSGRFAREGVDLSLSTLADLIGHACVALAPIHAMIARHVLSGARLHGDDTTVPLLARGGTRTARLWTCARDDQPLRRH